MKLQYPAYLPGMCGLVLACLVAVPLVQAQLQLPAFTVADKNADGILGIAEAQAVFPALVFRDSDQDGLLSNSEAEEALPGYLRGNDDHEDEYSLVGLSEYILMAQRYARTFGEATTEQQ